MMENSPDPGETEEEEEEESGISSPKANPSLLEEIRMLSQATNNNNCSYEGQPFLKISDIRAVLNHTLIYIECFNSFKLFSL